MRGSFGPKPYKTLRGVLCLLAAGDLGGLGGAGFVGLGLEGVLGLWDLRLWVL